jgi:hypothetical protein
VELQKLAMRGSLESPRSSVRRWAVAAVAAAAASSVGVALALPPASTLRARVAEMKEAPRGPFVAIRWFCEDGSVRPARAGCSGHGGGFQHGEWTDQVKEMRAGGYLIANLFVDLDAEQFTGAGAEMSDLKQILLERFLVEFDEGWILRAVRTYRGAMQAEDEEAGAARVVDAMMRDPRWQTDERFFLLKEVVRLFPSPREAGDVTASEVRQRAMWLGARDRAFTPLRVKIHNVPDSGDAERVREFARERGRPQFEETYALLADDIERLYGGRFAAKDAKLLAATLPTGNLRDAITTRANNLAAASDPFERLKLAGQLSALYRKYGSEFTTPAQRRALMEASLGAEEEMYLSGNELVAHLDRATRAARLAWIRGAIDGLYGTGLITQRHALGVREAIQRLQEAKDPTLEQYRTELRYIARAPEWANGTIQANFGDVVNHFAAIEPLARMYPQDRLRGSPFLFYGAVLDSLLKDADILAGVQHSLFGETVYSGLRALNPGLARGVIRVPRNVERLGGLDRDGIYLLPETVADLPPVAGILTEGEGSSLSHIQLLARNLGIPNVVVGGAHLEAVRARAGDRVVLAVSPGGSVRLDLDGPQWDRAFGEQSAAPAVVIRPDLEKLDLDETDILTLDDLRADDSGRVVGPKAANLGELRRHFGERVPQGFAIPFGVFRAFLDRPIQPGGPSAFEWMKSQYREIARLRGDQRAKERAEKAFLEKIRRWIETTDPGVEFRTQVTDALRESFGPSGSYGVFVRSDTNVEDLPGFTGAGLNLTVPNVVGEAQIMSAIQRVWASPFSERSYAWRQSHMTQPEYVFPSVLVQKAFPSEKSGVMVTSDVEGGGARYLTVAVNEGIGGAVDGQAAESLRIDRKNGDARILAQATAKTRRELAPSGGLREVPTSGGDRILQDAEVRSLVRLAGDVEDFPALRNDAGDVVPADVEFAFRGGELALLQIRPFNESAAASKSQYLAGMDGSTGSRKDRRVPLDQIPGGGG